MFLTVQFLYLKIEDVWKDQGRRRGTDSIQQPRQTNNLPSLPTLCKYLPKVNTWGMDCRLNHTDITKNTHNKN
jgi:hypothetical protein